MQSISGQRSSQNKALGALFSLWMLSLPFYQFSVVGTLSVDNLLAPLLLVFWMFAAPLSASSAKRVRRILFIAFIVFIYFLFSIISLTISGSSDLILAALIQEIKVVLYLLLPVLCISSITLFRKALRLVVYGTAVVSVSAFMQAIGLVQFEFARSAASGRLGTDIISRSPGILGNYGDVAILISISVLATYGSLWRDRRPRRLLKYALYFIFILGALAAQSRNVVFSVFVAIAVYNFFRNIYKKKAHARVTYIVLNIVAIMFGAFLLWVVFPYIYAAVLGTGGVKQSVLARFEQYQEAINLIAANPIFGVGAEIGGRYAQIADTLHNLWLGIGLRGGVLAIVSLAILFLSGFLGSVRRIVNDAVAQEAAIMSATALAMLTASMFYVAQGSYIFWACLGLLLSFTSLDDLRAGSPQRQATSSLKSRRSFEFAGSGAGGRR